MKKIIALALIGLAIAAHNAFGQTNTMLNLRKYAEYFGFKNGTVDPDDDYIFDAPAAESGGEISREIIEGIKNIITNFFLNPNVNTYAAIVVIANHFNDQLSRDLAFALHAGGAYDAAVRSLSPELMTRLNNDMLNKTAIPANVQNDPTVKKVTQNVTLKF